jgi:DNA polymerase-3 subunit delta'
MWENIIGQTTVINTLKNITKNNKLAHAYIFFGPGGVGKDAVAIEFAKMVNCDNLPDDLNPCNTCRSCRPINSLSSPEFKFITALPTSENESDKSDSPVDKLSKDDYELYLGELAQKSSDPYYKISIPRANFIRIDSIRQIKKEVYLTGAKGKKKIFLISNCDTMSPVSANSLLKILEDPPGNSLMILTTSRLNSLPPTIIGRCQKIKFSYLTTEDLKFYMKNKYPELTKTEIEFYSRISEGSITKLREIISSDYIQIRDLMIEMLRSVATRKNVKLQKEIKIILEDKNKERIKQFLQMIQVWFRDVIYYSENVKDKIINSDQSETLDKFLRNIESDNHSVIRLIENSIELINMNINPESVLNKTMHDLQSKIIQH